MYLHEASETETNETCAPNLKRFAPRRFHRNTLCIELDRVDFPPKEQQNAVHDAHDQMRGLRELAHCGDVSGFDGLFKNIDHL